MSPQVTGHKRSCSTGDIRTSETYRVPPATSETVQIASRGMAMRSNATRAVERRDQEMRVRVKAEPESPDNAISSQNAYHYAGTTSSGPQHRKHREEMKTIKTDGPFSRHHTVRIKVEDRSSPETPRRYPSVTATWSKSPLRVPTPVAEQFYRSTIIKKENEEALTTPDRPSPQSRHSTPSITSSDAKLMAEAFRDFDSSHPAASKLKPEPAASPPTTYYIPKGANRIKQEAPPSTPSSIYHPQNRRFHHEAPLKAYPESDSSPHISRTRSHCTVAPTLELRSETEFSYLQPVTPTPFSTPYGVANPYPHSTPSYYIPGSLIEGVKRRAKWGHRDRRTKRAPPLQVLGARCADPVENVDGNNRGKVGDTGRGRSCAWYKIPFCKCCKWIRGIKTKCSRTGKRKWWYLQRSKQPRQHAERRRDDEFYDARRGSVPDMGGSSVQDL